MVVHHWKCNPVLEKVSCKVFDMEKWWCTTGDTIKPPPSVASLPRLPVVSSGEDRVEKKMHSPKENVLFYTYI